MGFLNGAYGKLMAGKLVRDLQYQMTSVQSRLRCVTRQIGLKEKMYQAQERNMKQALQYQMYASQMGQVQGIIEMGGVQGANGMQQMTPEQLQQLGVLAQTTLGAVTGGGMNLGAGLQLGAFDQGVTTMFSGIQQRAQMQYTQAQTIWSNIFEMQKEADLQALKDLEEDLQTEKDNLESRLQIAKQEYDAKKEEEKDGAKNLQPNYTGQ